MPVDIEHSLDPFCSNLQRLVTAVDIHRIRQPGTEWIGSVCKQQPQLRPRTNRSGLHAKGVRYWSIAEPNHSEPGTPSPHKLKYPIDSQGACRFPDSDNGMEIIQVRWYDGCDSCPNMIHAGAKTWPWESGDIVCVCHYQYMQFRMNDHYPPLWIGKAATDIQRRYLPR